MITTVLTSTLILIWPQPKKTYTIKGRILDSDGTPFQASIYIKRKTDLIVGQIYKIHRVAECDPDGYFEFDWDAKKGEINLVAGVVLNTSESSLDINVFEKNVIVNADVDLGEIRVDKEKNIKHELAMFYRSGIISKKEKDEAERRGLNPTKELFSEDDIKEYLNDLENEFGKDFYYKHQITIFRYLGIIAENGRVTISGTIIIEIREDAFRKYLEDPREYLMKNFDKIKYLKEELRARKRFSSDSDPQIKIIPIDELPESLKEELIESSEKKALDN